MPVSVDCPASPNTTSPGALGCVALADVFTDELLEAPPTASAPVAQRRRHDSLQARARQACLDCPLATQCLYRAVVEHDVAGYVAGTTERQRLEIRRRLGITVEHEDFDTLSGVTSGHRQIDHDEVVRLRRSNPHESLDRLAQRLGCSLSTVKRHLRRERSQPSTVAASNRRPPLTEVLAVTAELLHPTRRSAVAA